MSAKKVVIMVGSKSDLKQCKKGLEWVKANPDKIIVEEIYVTSQHRHTLNTQAILIHLAERQDTPDAIIIGAGWANHLTGCCDAFLRYQLKNSTIPVIGVAFDDKTNGRHTEAAILSITEVPKTKVNYHDFVGEEGFLHACKYSALGDFPPIELSEPPEPMRLNLDRALAIAAEK